MKLKSISQLWPPLILAALLLLLLPAHALATLEVQGNEADKTRFNELIDKCKRESRSFKDLMDRIERSNKTVTVKVGRNQPGVVPDSFDGKGAGTIDLDDMEKFPNPRKNPETGRGMFQISQKMSLHSFQLPRVSRDF